MLYQMLTLKILVKSQPWSYYLFNICVKNEKMECKKEVQMLSSFSPPQIVDIHQNDAFTIIRFEAKVKRGREKETAYTINIKPNETK